MSYAELAVGPSSSPDYQRYGASSWHHQPQYVHQQYPQPRSFAYEASPQLMSSPNTDNLVAQAQAFDLNSEQSAFEPQAEAELPSTPSGSSSYYTFEPTHQRAVSYGGADTLPSSYGTHSAPVTPQHGHNPRFRAVSSSAALQRMHDSSPMHSPSVRHEAVFSSPLRSSSVPRAIQPTQQQVSTLKVIKWSPQSGEEGEPIAIVLDSTAAVHLNLLSSPTIPAPRTPRRFRVSFGYATAPTRHQICTADEAGLNQPHDSMRYSGDVVVVTSFVPARDSMGTLDERILVKLQVVEVEQPSVVVEELAVGEWDAAAPAPHQRAASVSSGIHMPSTPSPHRGRKRAGDTINSGREPGSAFASPNPSSANASPFFSQGPWSVSPSSQHVADMSASSSLDAGSRPSTPPPSRRRQRSSNTPTSKSTPSGANLRHPPKSSSTGAQPDLLRTTRISSGEPGSPFSTFTNRAVLSLNGDLDQMAMGWNNEEWTSRRRLLRFWRHQSGNVIKVNFGPIPQHEYSANDMIVISCIFRDDKNECYVTSVDVIYLLEALVGVHFDVEEKNRIRRNLEGFKPITISKSKTDAEPFFKLIMGFPNPKPRNIEKDVKVFPWSILSKALTKIIGKYSATYIAAAAPASMDGTTVAPSSLDHSDDVGDEDTADATIQPRWPSQEPRMVQRPHSYSGHDEDYAQMLVPPMASPRSESARSAPATRRHFTSEPDTLGSPLLMSAAELPELPPLPTASLLSGSAYPSPRSQQGLAAPLST